MQYNPGCYYSMGQMVYAKTFKAFCFKMIGKCLQGIIILKDPIFRKKSMEIFAENLQEFLFVGF